MKNKGLCPVIAFHLDTFMALNLFKELLKVCYGLVVVCWLTGHCWWLEADWPSGSLGGTPRGTLRTGHCLLTDWPLVVGWWMTGPQSLEGSPQGATGRSLFYRLTGRCWWLVVDLLLVVVVG